MKKLSKHQNESIRKYFEFKRMHPEYFKKRKFRKIITETEVLKNFAIEHDVAIGLSAETPYFYLVTDLVQGAGQNSQTITYPYLRLIYKNQLNGVNGVVILGTIENEKLGVPGSIVFVQQERHATGKSHLELPRGFCEKGMSREENARRELLEETGFIGEKSKLIGTTYSDTGLTDNKVSFYHISITDQSSFDPEVEEAISEVKIMKKKETMDKITKGIITDGFTIQALMFFDLAYK
ncbi:MAG: NUDIX hydrolase [Desulfobacterales bacterium]|nr:NUDIX hydrolase [Desulfobacterales bacterium]